MTGLTPYLFFPGTAAEALNFYAEVFGGEVSIHSYAAFGRDDGPADATAHGELSGLVQLFAADAGPGEDVMSITGVVFSLLGTADAATLTTWFAALAVGGEIVDPLQERPWGAHDGRVTDRFGISWLIGYEP